MKKTILPVSPANRIPGFTPLSPGFLPENPLQKGKRRAAKRRPARAANPAIRSRLPLIATPAQAFDLVRKTVMDPVACDKRKIHLAIPATPGDSRDSTGQFPASCPACHAVTVRPDDSRKIPPANSMPSGSAIGLTVVF